MFKLRRRVQCKTTGETGVVLARRRLWGMWRYEVNFRSGVRVLLGGDLRAVPPQGSEGALFEPAFEIEQMVRRKLTGAIGTIVKVGKLIHSGPLMVQYYTVGFLKEQRVLAESDLEAVPRVYGIDWAGGPSVMIKTGGFTDLPPKFKEGQKVYCKNGGVTTTISKVLPHGTYRTTDSSVHNDDYLRIAPYQEPKFAVGQRVHCKERDVITVIKSIVAPGVYVGEDGKRHGDDCLEAAPHQEVTGIANMIKAINKAYGLEGSEHIIQRAAPLSGVKFDELYNDVLRYAVGLARSVKDPTTPTPQFKVGQTVWCRSSRFYGVLKEKGPLGWAISTGDYIFKPYDEDELEAVPKVGIDEGVRFVKLPEFKAGQRVRCGQKEGVILDYFMSEEGCSYVITNQPRPIIEEGLEAVPYQESKAEKVGFSVALKAFLDGKRIKRAEWTSYIHRDRATSLDSSNMLADDWVILP